MLLVISLSLSLSLSLSSLFETHSRKINKNEKQVASEIVNLSMLATYDCN